MKYFHNTFFMVGLIYLQLMNYWLVEIWVHNVVDFPFVPVCILLFKKMILSSLYISFSLQLNQGGVAGPHGRIVMFLVAQVTNHVSASATAHHHSLVINLVMDHQKKSKVASWEIVQVSLIRIFTFVKRKILIKNSSKLIL